MKTLALSLCLLGLTACGSTGVQNAQLLQTVIPPEQARITVTRPSAFLYVGVGANVMVDGKKIASIGSGGSVVHDVDKGRHLIVVDAWSTPGQFAVGFDAEAGKHYKLSVTPRSENYWGNLAWGIGGEVLNARVNQNTGPFQVTLEEVE